VAKVFPVFFFLIAALVCSTTMTRMVDDERGQIGTFRALGYSNAAIISKYLIYAGSAAIIGCLVGYAIGTYAFPMVIWSCYGMLYGFAPLVLKNSAVLLIICILVALICSVGTAFLACKNELRCMPAELIRPKAPAAGKRILLEHIGFIWKRMKFLHKVTARNVFRFKKRMFMMLVGIAGCTALVMTGLGIGDSVSNIAEFQYDDIDVHDIELTFSGDAAEVEEKVDEAMGEDMAEMTSFYKTSVEYTLDDSTKAVYLEAVDGDEISKYENFNILKGSESYPEPGEVMISEKLADMSGIEAGDDIVFSYGDNKEVTLTVSSVYENYVWHYAYISEETYRKYFDEAYEPNTIYMNVNSGCDVYEKGAKLGDIDGVLNVLVINEQKDRVANMMQVMNSVVLLVIGCAGALAFIVLFNLSNINITERVREIATIKVLGFYPGETGSYVFRENLVLTIMGIIIGVPLGVLLHGFVMSQINIDMVAFKVVILPKSYVIGVLTVLVFLVVVDLVMRRKIEAIDMAESLKSVE
jgi:putative ABC transport system permease protein